MIIIFSGAGKADSAAMDEMTATRLLTQQEQFGDA
jgi:hypothetical protein